MHYDQSNFKLGKCSFMVIGRIALGGKINSKVIEVDQANIEVIEILPKPINVKEIRSFKDI